MLSSKKSRRARHIDQRKARHETMTTFPRRRAALQPTTEVPEFERVTEA